jgi:hypothetical protein
MGWMLVAGGAAAFAVGLAVGAALTLALARDKFRAMTQAADRASVVLSAQSSGALKDLADAHRKAEAMIGAIETAKLSTARAGTSVTGLIANIHESRDGLEKAAQLSWFPAFGRTRPMQRAAPEETPPEPSLD